MGIIAFTPLLIVFSLSMTIGLCLNILVQQPMKIKDLIYFLALGMVSSMIFLPSILFDVSRDILTLVINVIVVLGYVYFLHTKKGYAIKEALILIFPILIIASITDLIAMLFAIQFELLTEDAILTGLSLFIQVSIMLPVTSFFTGFSRSWRMKVKQTLELQVTIISFFAFMFIIYHTLLLTAIYNFNVVLAALLVQAVVLIIFALIFKVYTNVIEMKYRMQLEEKEHRALQYYTTIIEQQYTELRKFKHDYQNILTSLNGFIDEGDFAGLKDYFNNQVKVSSERITKQAFALEDLSRIKVKEIKGILTAKLVIAQQKDVTVQFDAREDIDKIPMDTVALVRMLGIILDNAIEELVELKASPLQGNGQRGLQVGVWKEQEGVTFVIQNTCRPGIPKWHVLKKPGFSTKGTDRGLGLVNLIEIVEEQPDVLLQTSIADQRFMQKIVIGA